MKKISNDTINAVRNQVDITEVISQYIPIEKKGNNFLSLCPFHDDNNPSLTISPDKQIFKCFVCGAGGNVFTFVQNYEKVSFIESVAKVAESTTIEVDLGLELNHIDPYKEKLYDIMEDAKTYLNYNLLNSSNEFILSYIKERELTEDIIKRFEIGYEYDHSLVQYLKRKNYSLDDAVAINLLFADEYGKRSVFNNRLLFPIRDHQDNTVAFTARALSESRAKYINSNENEIYVKSNILYNYGHAKKAVHSEGVIFLVEGVMDVIAFYRAGHDNVVASLGTALSEQQVRSLRELSGHVVIAYDGDAAGQLATIKAIEELLALNIRVEVVTGFNDLDPDDFFKKQGKDKFRKQIQERTSWIDFVFYYNQDKFNLDNYLEQKEFAKKMLAYSKYLRDDFDQQYFYNKLKELTGVSFQEAKRSRFERKPQPVSSVFKINEHRSEISLLTQMLISKQAAYYIRDNLGFLIHDELYEIYLHILDYYSRYDKMEIADLLSFIGNDRLNNIVLDIVENQNVVKEFDQNIVDEEITAMKLKVIDDKILTLRRKQNDDIDENIKIALQIAELKQEKEELKFKKEID